MPTIGKRWPRTAPYGDIVVMCDICGVNYRRAQLVKRGDGLWACSGPGTTNDAEEVDAVTLSRENAAGARRQQPAGGPSGVYSKPDSLTLTHNTTLDDIYS